MSGRFNIWKTEITYLKKVGPKRAEVLGAEEVLPRFPDVAGPILERARA